jgi:type IV fimbrial biogenesis protein FimT
MKARGFTVVELVVVIGIMGILLTLATLEFGRWQRKSMVEKEVQELYADIQKSRMQAAFTKVNQGILFSAQQVSFRTLSSASDKVGAQSSVKALRTGISTNFSASPQSNYVYFNTNGVMTDAIDKVVCFDVTDEVAYDAIIITHTLTSLGKQVDRGEDCARINVVQK